MSALHLDPSLDQAPLGKSSLYLSTYTPSLLFAIPRHTKREELGLTAELPFTGVDLWNGYELSWLDLSGKPVVAAAELMVPSESANIFESKSLKLYFNSFNNSRFASLAEVQALAEADLTRIVAAPVAVRIFSLDAMNLDFRQLEGLCLDDLDVECNTYLPDPSLLGSAAASSESIEECLYSHLLKSNCLVTGQPDWGSLEIRYRGPRFNYPGLLRYLVSLRDHHEFHEQCLERLFVEISRAFKPEWLSVYARYVRRGGWDINPYRVSAGSPIQVDNRRINRQ